MRKAVRFTAALAAIVLVALPVAIAGAHSGVVVFQGTATLGAPIAFPICTGGVCNPGDTTWKITVDPGATPPQGTCSDRSGLASGTGCKFLADGALRGAFGQAALGPWCGASSGTSGEGSADVFVTTAGESHNLVTGWVTSAGTIIPLTGTYSGHGSGQMVTLTRSAAGTTPTDTTTMCLSGSAQTFGVIGISLPI